MRSERTPWTCRWSEYRPASPAPLWLDEWMTQWACLVERRRDTASSVDRCLDCARWEPRDAWTGPGTGGLEH